MSRRLVALILLFFPLLFSIIAWIWSSSHTELLGYQSAKGEWCVELAPDELVFWSSPRSSNLKLGWNYWHTGSDVAIGEIYTGLGDWHFAGLHFFVGKHPYAPGTTVLFVLPFWFLTTLSLTTMLLAPFLLSKRKAASAFPIVPESLNPKKQ